MERNSQECTSSGRPVSVPGFSSASVKLRVCVRDETAAQYISNILKRISLVTEVSVETGGHAHVPDLANNPNGFAIEKLLPEPPPGADPRLVLAACILESNFYDPHLSLRSVSKMVGLSPCYLSRRFNLFFRANFRTQLRRIRIKHATILLESTALSIKEIAAYVGYKHMSDLGRDFKGLHAVSPSVFRRSDLRRSGTVRR